MTPEKKENAILAILIMIFIAMVVTIAIPHVPSFRQDPVNSGEIIDDWELNIDSMKNDRGGVLTKSIGGGMANYAASPNVIMESADGIGFSTGGAKDINNFRENIENGYLPLPTDITYEGLFYDYYFDTGETKSCDELFCPSYSFAVTDDPFSEEEEYYLAVGLNSGIKDFERKKLNLVVVLDISGSMGSPFDRYYYDRFGNYVENKENAHDTKMEVAREAIVDLISHLKDGDRFGIVLFDNDAYLAKPMRDIAYTDMDSIKEHILELTPQGGTHMSAGIKKGTELLSEYENSDPEVYENRMIFLTDAMPNIGETSESGLLGMTKKNAKNGLYTTFIGIGVDFNTELIDSITKIRGANYYSVHSADEFKDRMDEGFDYMVTPLVFDLKLELEADGYDIKNVYGSPEADKATGEIMYVNTLFPSQKADDQTKGGLILIKLDKDSSDARLTLTATYEDRSGDKSETSTEVSFGGKRPEYFENNGIRKGILLARYADLMKDWIIDERTYYPEPMPVPLVDYEVGIRCPPPIETLGQWERKSVRLLVSREYEKLFEQFSEYFKTEMEAVKDPSLEKEFDILKKLN